MPTINPRTNVTLSPSLDSLVARLAAAAGSSKSQVLRELLEAAEPGLQRAVTLMEAASTAHADVLSRLGASLNAAQDQAERAIADVMSDMDRMGNDLVDQAQAVRPKRPARTRAAGQVVSERSAQKVQAKGLTPVPVTRGSGSSTMVRKGSGRGRV